MYIISGLHEYFICLEAPELCVTQPGCMQLLIVVQKIKGFHGNPANLQIKFNYRIGGNFCEGFNLVNWQIPNAIAKFTIRQNYCTESEYASRERVTSSNHVRTCEDLFLLRFKISEDSYS